MAGDGNFRRASSSIFCEMSMPTADVAPCSIAYWQCQPKPQPRSRMRLPRKSGRSLRNSCHSPAPRSPSVDRAIRLYLPKNVSSSYLFSFIRQHAPFMLAGTGVRCAAGAGSTTEFRALRGIWRPCAGQRRCRRPSAFARAVRRRAVWPGAPSGSARGFSP